MIGEKMKMKGIEGIIIGIGIEVDENIIIKERISEEKRKGIGEMEEIEKGLKREFEKIVEENVKKMKEKIIMLMLGKGKVRGLEVKMMIGIEI